MADTQSGEAVRDVVVIGAGAMGLAAAHHLGRAGHSPLVLEAAPEPGGMAAHSDFNGISLERFYHFVCKTDFDTFDLMDELGIGDQMVWKSTKMGYYAHGKVHDWGNPVALLKYPHLNPIEKFRYGLMAWWCTKRKSWDGAEQMTAPDWLRAWLGESCYQKMWQRLLHQKFFEYTDVISASWIGTRVQRVGNSRKSLMEEQLGHIAGGSQTLVDALVASIDESGGEVRCSAPVANVSVREDGLKEITISGGETVLAREIVSTAPLAVAGKVFQGLTDAEQTAYSSVDNIGCVCLVYHLDQPVTGKFWLNLMDEAHAIPGLIEFSALRDFEGETIVYAPYYMPVTNERWAWSDEALLDEAFEAIRAVNPAITSRNLNARLASRLTHSQPICTPNFADTLMPIDTSLPGVQIADTCYYYPEDRGISESVGLAKSMAQTAIDRLAPAPALETA
ncbi:MAG: NAD(P)/FAD-dependent oxidoreductase [Pseudomonadota bacterium]